MKALALSLILVLAALPAHAGFDSGNAGDAYAAEFIFSGRDVLQRLELMEKNKQTIVDTAKLRAAMETTSVVTEDHVYLDGMERDAVNFPSQKLIKIGRERWNNLRRASETKARLSLVLHEFLWVTGVDDTNFTNSGKIIDQLKIPPYSPAIWLYVPGIAFATAECTGRMKDGSFVTVTVTTKGVTKAPDHGEVSIEKMGNKFGYRFSAADISQFFEFADEKANTATIGLGAYIGAELPITVKYNGPNYIDMDLTAVLTSGVAAAGTPSGNTMRVWKGPGYLASDSYDVQDQVCSIWSNN
jgi:hypothetical protein